MQRIKAYIRIRPLLSNENECFINVNNNKLYIDNSYQDYSYSSIFSPDKSNLDVFKESILPLYNHWIKGFNVSVLCYGQTCSGKTYTCFGSKHCSPSTIYNDIKPGISQLLIKKLFYDIKKGKLSNIHVYGSFIEIYNEYTYDLLQDNSVKSNISCSIRENDRGQFIIPNLIKKRLTSFKEAQELLEFGNQQKRFGNSALHNRSSRSHTIFRIYLAYSNTSNNTISLSELNIVDLAGSEILSYKYGQTQQEETKSINLSLLALKRVIRSLADNSKHIPYRQSLLTKLLQNSLGGNSLTSLLCMISPNKEHQSVSQGTLRFGQIVQQIKVSVKPIQIKSKQTFHSNADLSTSKSCLKEYRIPESEQYLKESNTKLLYNITYVHTKIGNIAINEISVNKNELQSNSYLAVILHAFGSGCSGLDWDYLFEPLLNSNCSVIAPDLPGFGYSYTLPRISSRTEDHCKNEDSPVFILKTILNVYQKKYGKKRIILLGYDYGGGLAASFALKFPKYVFRIIMFHPSWTMPLAPLNSLKTNTLLLWVPVDQLHVYSRGTKMYKAIPHCTFIKCNIGPYSNSKAGGYYHAIGNHIAKYITEWLPQIQTKSQQSTIKNIQKTTKNISNDNQVIIANDKDFDNIVCNMINKSSFLPDIASENKKKIETKEEPIIQLQTYDKPKHDCTKIEQIIWAVNRFKELYEKGLLDKVYKDYLSNTTDRPSAVRLFGSLPILDPMNLKIDDMIKWNIWNTNQIKWIPKNVYTLSPRFIPGQQIFIKTTVEGSMFSGNDYLTYNPNSDTYLLTYKAYIISEEDEYFKVKVKLPKNSLESYKVLSILKHDIYLYNSPTPFKLEAEGYLFEDKVHCKYSDLLTRAKLMEAIINITKILPNTSNNKELYTPNDIINIQKQCINKIWKVIDITHFDHVGLHATRSMKPNVGKLAYFGQGNCHTLASVLAAFLLPFGKILGWEVTYRAGFFYKPETRDGNGFNGIPRSISDHTWLEVCLLPSLNKYVCDPSFDEICCNLNDIYCLSGKRHPEDKPQCQVSFY